jgi:2-oxo-4-hydroxy-4-carboxy-5-ureidoimidazoline decarboxylase
MRIEVLNSLDAAAARDELLRCCGSKRWASELVQVRPFADIQSLLSASDRIWSRTEKVDWLEAFKHHPRIGDIGSLRAKFVSTSQWAEQEQKGAQGASEQTLQALAAGNQAYEARFGHIFLVCATGKSADEMLSLLNERMKNTPSDELQIAAAEQNKITHLRLEKLLNS